MTHVSIDIPLAENELHQSMCAQFKDVLSVHKHKYDSLTSGEVEDVPVRDYRKIIINSANREQDEYNLYEYATFCKDSIWFGYRVCDSGPMRNYNGFHNWMSCGGPTTEMSIITDVAIRNLAAGFGTIYDCYTPHAMLKYLTYEMPKLDEVPICYKEIPFELRNIEGDTIINNEIPPWVSLWYGENGMGSFLGEMPPGRVHAVSPSLDTFDSLNNVFKKRIVADKPGENNQSQNVQDSVSEPPTACSSPIRLSTVTNRGDTRPSPKRKAKPKQALKRRKGSKFVIEEADDDDELQVVAPA